MKTYLNFLSLLVFLSIVWVYCLDIVSKDINIKVDKLEKDNISISSFDNLEIRVRQIEKREEAKKEEELDRRIKKEIEKRWLVDVYSNNIEGFRKYCWKSSSSWVIVQWDMCYNVKVEVDEIYFSDTYFND